MTDLLQKPSNQRIPKKQHKNTCTTDEGRFGKKPWITLRDNAFTENSQASRLETLGYGICDPVHWESWAAFVSRTVLCNSWGARGTADLKIHTPTSPSPPISLSPPFWNGNAFTLRRLSAVARNVFDAVTYFLSAAECHDREGLGKKRTPLTSSNSSNADHFFKMAVDSASVVWSVVKLVWSAQLFSCLLAMV